MTHIFIDNINSGRLSANFGIVKIIKYKIVIFNKKKPIYIIKKLAINIVFFSVSSYVFYNLLNLN